MNLVQFFKLYLIAVPVFFAIDLIWLGLVAQGFYQSQIGSLMRESVRWVPAVIFYLLFVAGIILFAVWPGIENSSILKTLALGAALGFLAYATYDLTNLATLKDWPVKIVVVDIIWGSVLSGGVSAITYYIYQLLSG